MDGGFSVHVPCSANTFSFYIGEGDMLMTLFLTVDAFLAFLDRSDEYVHTSTGEPFGFLVVVHNAHTITPR